MNFPGGQPGLVMATIRERVGLSEVAESVDEFREALNAATASSSENERSKRVFAAFKRFVAKDHEHATEETETTVYLNLLAHHANEESQQLIREIYQQFDAELQPLYRQMLELLGLRLRRPFQIEHFAAGMTAIAEGLGIRQVVDHATDADLSETAYAMAEGLLKNMTKPA